MGLLINTLLQETPLKSCIPKAVFSDYTTLRKLTPPPIVTAISVKFKGRHPHVDHTVILCDSCSIFRSLCYDVIFPICPSPTLNPMFCARELWYPNDIIYLAIPEIHAPVLGPTKFGHP